MQFLVSLGVYIGAWNGACSGNQTVLLPNDHQAYVQVRELFEMVNQEVQHVLQFDHRGIGA